MATAENIHDDHAELRVEMRDVEAQLSGLREDGSPEAIARFHARLTDYRSHLRNHFQDEERSESFASFRNGDPMARVRVDKLCLQHREFLGELDRILVDLGSGAITPEGLESIALEVDHLFTNLRWHDSVETGLLKRLAER